MASDARLNRVYFGTDTRAQALLVGAAAAALLVRDWPAVLAGWSPIRSRWVKWVARILPVLGVVVLAEVVHRATGKRHGIPPRSADRGRGGRRRRHRAHRAGPGRPGGPGARGAAAGLAGSHLLRVYLWHWPIFLVLNGERTGWSGYPLFAARCAATLGAAALSWWLIEQPVRRWQPVHVPVLRLAGATAATAVAVTMVVVPQATRTGSGPMPDVRRRLGGDGATRPPAHAGPRPHTVAVFGDRSPGRSCGTCRPHRASAFWTARRSAGWSAADRTGTAAGAWSRSRSATPGRERWSERIAHDRPDVVLLTIGRWETVDRMWRGTGRTSAIRTSTST